jgi:nicotinamide riboside kinase
MKPAASRPLRVVVYGPESTGKSTLAEHLAARFAAPWSPEYVREYWDTHGGVVTATDLDAIARGQRAAEDAARARAEADGARVAFHDTDLLTCTIWDDLLFPGAGPTGAATTGRGSPQRRATALAFLVLLSGNRMPPPAPPSPSSPSRRASACRSA